MPTCSTQRHNNSDSDDDTRLQHAEVRYGGDDNDATRLALPQVIPVFFLGAIFSQSHKKKLPTVRKSRALSTKSRRFTSSHITSVSNVSQASQLVSRRYPVKTLCQISYNIPSPCSPSPTATVKTTPYLDEPQGILYLSSLSPMATVLDGSPAPSYTVYPSRYFNEARTSSSPTQRCGRTGNGSGGASIPPSPGTTMRSVSTPRPTVAARKTQTSDLASTSPSYSPIASVDASTDDRHAGSVDQCSKVFTTVTRGLVDGMPYFLFCFLIVFFLNKL